MNPIYIYPGSFSPPTYGHLSVVKKAAELVPNLTIVCSTNPEKNSLFNEKESSTLWMAYELPANVRVKTFVDFFCENPVAADIVMIRGIRNEKDFEEENRVAIFNCRNFNVTKFFYIVADIADGNVSSTAARCAAAEGRLKDLPIYVAHGVIDPLLKKISQRGLQQKPERESWQLNEEYRLRAVRSASFPYTNQRHINKVGD